VGLSGISSILQNQPKYMRDKAIEIVNEMLKGSGDKAIAITKGFKLAR